MNKCNLIAKEIRSEHRVRVDPDKHTLEQLQDLQKRLLWVKRMRKEYSHRTTWQTKTAKELRKEYWKIADKWICCD